jgi:hypothetical protein
MLVERSGYKKFKECQINKGGMAMAGYVAPIEKQTLKNEYFRQVLFTGKYAQLVVMCLQPGEEIRNEVHAKVCLQM